MLTIACVFRSGGEYQPEHLEMVKRFRDNISIQSRLICLTDQPEKVADQGLQSLPLTCGWRGWWSKMELFRIPPPVLYTDIDMIPVGDLTPLANVVTGLAQSQFLMLRDAYHFDECSAIMGWNCDMKWLFDQFKQESKIGEWFPTTSGEGVKIGDDGYYQGDQEYIRHALRGRKEVILAQSCVGGLYSYKVDVLSFPGVPPDARLIYYHGKPRPWETSLYVEAASGTVNMKPQAPIRLNSEKDA